MVEIQFDKTIFYSKLRCWVVMITNVKNHSRTLDLEVMLKCTVKMPVHR